MLRDGKGKLFFNNVFINGNQLEVLGKNKNKKTAQFTDLHTPCAEEVRQ